MEIQGTYPEVDSEMANEKLESNAKMVKGHGNQITVSLQMF